MQEVTNLLRCRVDLGRARVIANADNDWDRVSRFQVDALSLGDQSIGLRSTRAFWASIVAGCIVITAPMGDKLIETDFVDCASKRYPAGMVIE